MDRLRSRVVPIRSRVSPIRSRVGPIRPVQGSDPLHRTLDPKARRGAQTAYCVEANSFARGGPPREGAGPQGFAWGGGAKVTHLQ